MPGAEQRREPLQAHYRRPASPRDLGLDPPDPGTEIGDEPARLIGTPDRAADAFDVGEDGLDRVSVQRNDGRRRPQRYWQLRNGDRANLAERLAKQDVWPGSGQRDRIKVEGALTAVARGTDLRVDRQAVTSCLDRRAGNARQKPYPRRVVTIVRDRDEFVPRTERAGDLGPGWDKRNDPHVPRLGDVIEQAIRDAVAAQPGLVAEAMAQRPKSWGALAAQGVLAFRRIAGRAPTEAERRAVWAGLWRVVMVSSPRTSGSAERYALMWSGGKDSALALMRARSHGLTVTRLINFYDPATDRVRFHATRSGLITAQADALGIAILQLGTTWADYEARFIGMLADLRRDGFAGVVFGDIHLADVRAWYEERVRASALEHVEPLWGESSLKLVAEFVASGSRAVVTCVELPKLGEAWLGRVIDERFVQEIQSLAVDPAGENGEYHSFTFAGPLFRAPLRWRSGGRRFEGNFAQLDLELERAG